MQLYRNIYLIAGIAVAMFLAADKSFALHGIGATDSLYVLYFSEAFNDSTKVEAYLSLSWELKSTHPQNALAFADTALHLAVKIDYKSGISQAFNNKGVLYWQMNDFDNATDCLFKAYHLYSAQDDQSGVAKCLSNLGLIFTDRGQYAKAMEYYMMANEIYETQDNGSGLAAVLNNIGMVCQHQGDYEKAIEYHHKSLALKRQLGDTKGMAYSYNNLGLAHQALGDYKAANSFFELALVIRKQLPDDRERAGTLGNIGYTYLLKGNHQMALEYLEQAISIFQSIDDHGGLARMYSYLGLVRHLEGRYDAALSLFERSMVYARNLGLPRIISENYFNMAKVMATRGDFGSAYTNLEQYLMLRDSLNDDDSRRKILEMQFIYDRELKESEIELLQKVNEINKLNIQNQNILRNFLILIILLSFIFLMLLVSRIRYIKKANNELERSREEITIANEKLQEFNAMRDKLFSIISHDLRNPFASIVSFSRILKRDFKDLSQDDLMQLVNELDNAILKINNLLENLLQWSRSQSGTLLYDPEPLSLKVIVNEIVELFIPLAGQKQVAISAAIPDDATVWADANLTQVILRNLISNALKYTDSGDTIEVAAERFGEMIHISVTDTGTGISEENQLRLFNMDSIVSTYGTRDEKGSGLGLILCREFSEKQGGAIWFRSREGEGSAFFFSLPVREKLKKIS